MALLLNGRSGTSPFSSAVNTADSSCEPWVMKVVTGKTYRVRVIGSTAWSLVLLGIIDHENLTIIEIDNSYVYPVETLYMQVDTGQRFSFSFKAKEQSELRQLDGRSSFWIQFATREKSSVIYSYGILRYIDVDIDLVYQVEGGCLYPTSTQKECPMSFPPRPVLDLPTDVTKWLEYTFRNPPLPGYEVPPNATEVTRRVYINTGQFLDRTSGTNVMEMDGEVWVDSLPFGPTTHTPYLIEILQNGTIEGRASGNKTLSHGGDSNSYPRTWVAAIGDVIEIVWAIEASHPGGIYGLDPLHRAWRALLGHGIKAGVMVTKQPCRIPTKPLHQWRALSWIPPRYNIAVQI